MKKKILIVAGETSGDIQAGYLIKALKSINPDVEIFGVGGRCMKEAGADIIYNIVDLAVIGFVEVIKHLPTFRNLLKKLVLLLEDRKPDIVILVDYPGFNLHFAKYVKAKNIPVVYYISPQIWAWGKGRVSKIKKYVDKMLVIFGFEEELYKQAGVKVNFVGHPFLDIVHCEWKKEDILKQLHLKHTSIKIGIFPGSRENEIKKHLPIILIACEKIQKRIPDIEIILSRCKGIDKSIYNKIIAGSKIKPHSIENMPYEIMEISDLVIVSSGSATLETAIMQRPMVIIYKTSFLTWLLVRFMIKIPNIGLVNIVAGKRIVPELIQFKVTPKTIAKESLKILTNKALQKDIKSALKKVTEKLGEHGAIGRAAHIIQDIALLQS